MAKKFIFSFIFLLIYAPGIQAAALEPVEKADRILIMAPHPDDEAIGCAGIIQEALDKGAKVQVLFLTNGDHNQVAFIVYEKRLIFKRDEFIHMGEVRRKESAKAMELLGLGQEDLVFLGYPDFGTFNIVSKYWQTQKPFESLLTRISRVPYKENLSYGSPYTGESILNDLKKVILDFKPNKIFVSHAADVNVDHKTFYLFLEIALADLKGQILQPQVYPYLIHCIGWPLPRHYHPKLGLTPPLKFQNAGINWSEFELTKEQSDKKHKAILCYKSQTESSAFYLLAFARKNELFGPFSEIEATSEFSAPSDMYPLSGGVLKEPDNIQVSYAAEENNFLIHFKKEKKFNRKFSLEVYLFGYSAKTPFARMPKIRILSKYNKFRVFDGKRLINPEAVSFEFGPNELTLRLSLKVLGDPDFILSSIKAHKGSRPVVVTGFRKVVINK